MPWVKGQDGKYNYNASNIYFKCMLPTYDEFISFINNKLYTFIETDKEMDPYWEVERLKYLLVVSANQLNKMINEDKLFWKISGYLSAIRSKNYYSGYEEDDNDDRFHARFPPAPYTLNDLNRNKRKYIAGNITNSIQTDVSNNECLGVSFILVKDAYLKIINSKTELTLDTQNPPPTYFVKKMFDDPFVSLSSHEKIDVSDWDNITLQMVLKYKDGNNNYSITSLSSVEILFNVMNMLINQ